MSSDVRALLGDLVVATTDLVDTGAPPDERWLWLMIASGIAMRARPDDAAPDLFTTFEQLLWTTPLAAAFRDAARGRTAWRTRCLHRSALELLRDLFPRRDLDTSDLELAMIADGPGAYAAAPPPDGLPEHHWWWSAPNPPGSLRTTRYMANLLALGATAVPTDFRRFVSDGFVTIAGCTFFRATAPTDLAPPVIDPDGFESRRNTLRIEDYLPADDSRRPVDLAGSALACARWLAAELRRTVPQRCRIVAEVDRGRRSGRMTSRIRFFGLRQTHEHRDEVERQPSSAVLVLDSRD